MGINDDRVFRTLIRPGIVIKVYDVIGSVVKLGSGKYLRLAVLLESAVNNVESCVPFVVVVFYKCKSGDILASADGIQGMKETAEFTSRSFRLSRLS